MNLQYEDIFSAFLGKITDYSFLEYDDDFVKIKALAMGVDQNYVNAYFVTKYLK